MANRYLFYPTSRRGNAFLWTVIAEAIVVCTIEGIIFAKIQREILDPRITQLLTIPVYLAIFIFSQVFLVAIAWDALRLKSTIQTFGLCIFQAALVLYGALQIDQVRNAILDPDSLPYLTSFASSGQLVNQIHALLIVIPCVIAVALILCLALAVALHMEFGWAIYKQTGIGANLELRRMYAYLQVLLCLLKFDFFFFLGFTLQFIVLTLAAQDVEFALTIAVLPVTLAVLVVGALAAKYENTIIFFVFLLAQLLGLAYFIFKTFRLWQPSQAYKYISTRRTLTVFSAISIVLLIVTFCISVKVLLNFHRGLKGKTDPVDTEKQTRQRKDIDGHYSDDDLDFVKREPAPVTRKSPRPASPIEGSPRGVHSSPSPRPTSGQGAHTDHYTSASAYASSMYREP